MLLPHLPLAAFEYAGLRLGRCTGGEAEGEPARTQGQSGEEPEEQQQDPELDPEQDPEQEPEPEPQAADTDGPLPRWVAEARSLPGRRRWAAPDVSLFRPLGGATDPASRFGAVMQVGARLHTRVRLPHDADVLRLHCNICVIPYACPTRMGSRIARDLALSPSPPSPPPPPPQKKADGQQHLFGSMYGCGAEAQRAADAANDL